MDPALDPTIFAFSAVLACLIVAAGWTVVLALVWMWLRKRLEAMAQEHGPLPDPESNALLIYALCVLFWPAAFGLGFYFLPKAETAKQGRTALLIGMGHISVITYAVCLAMGIGAVVFAGQA